MGIIIALEGYAKKGKTSVLNLVISKIIMELDVYQIDKFHDYKDKTYVFFIKEKKVLVTTLGDDNNTLSNQLNNVKNYYKNYCDIIIYAKRPQKFFDCIKDLMSNHKFNEIPAITKRSGNFSEKKYITHSGLHKKMTSIKNDSINLDQLAANEVFNLLKNQL